MVYTLLRTLSTRASHAVHTRLTRDSYALFGVPLASKRPTLLYLRRAGEIGHMADRTLSRILATARASQAGHSEAYSWLRAKFEHLYPLLEQRRLTFQELADDLVASGKRGGRGKPVTAHAARDLWNRVQHDIAAQQPWRTVAARTAMHHGGAALKLRSRGPERGANADRPPPVVAAPTPMPPVPHYPPPPITPPAQSALHSRPNASPNGGSRTQTPEEMLADLDATIKRRNQYF